MQLTESISTSQISTHADCQFFLIYKLKNFRKRVLHTKESLYQSIIDRILYKTTANFKVKIQDQPVSSVTFRFTDVIADWPVLARGVETRCHCNHVTQIPTSDWWDELLQHPVCLLPQQLCSSSTFSSLLEFTLCHFTLSSCLSSCDAQSCLGERRGVQQTSLCRERGYRDAVYLL